MMMFPPGPGPPGLPSSSEQSEDMPPSLPDVLRPPWPLTPEVGYDVGPPMCDPGPDDIGGWGVGEETGDRPP